MSQNSAQILLQSLEKKNRLLDEILLENDTQEELLKQESPDMDVMDASFDRIGDLVERLDQLDQGFETVYDRVREELMGNRQQYRTEIERMKEQIQQITDKVVKINAGRLRNQRRLENFYKQKSQEIKAAVTKSRAAENYYNSMNKLNYVTPQFYDSKK